MKLIAKKPCSFGGRKFYIGDEIPAECVTEPRAQEKMGVLTMVSDTDAESVYREPEKKGVETVALKIEVKEGVLALDPTVEGLQAVFSAMTSNAEDAVQVVEAMEDGDALILLHLADARKSVKAAAEARAKALNGVDEE